MALKKKFRKYGDDVTFVSLSGDYHIYRRDTPDQQDDRPTHYEVIKPVNVGGELTYPGASQWGIYGWTCIGEPALVRKMAELKAKDEKRHTRNDTNQEVQA
jgi:hypothetical protein